MRISSKTGDFSTSVRLYSSDFRGDFVGTRHGHLVLTDFPFRFCILEPFCSTEDRCRTGRARIPRMPFYLFLSYRLSLLLPHSKSVTSSVARVVLSPTPTSMPRQRLCLFSDLAPSSNSLRFLGDSPSRSAGTQRSLFRVFRPVTVC